jgi:hypothetical protein
MTIAEFNFYKKLHLPAFEAYLAQANAYEAALLYVDTVIQNAIEFGKQLKRRFIAENVMMGITQLGLTNHVRKTLFQIDHAIATGSLKDAIEEIIDINPDSLDSVVLTAERVLKFRNEIELYLEVPLATQWNQAKTW